MEANAGACRLITTPQCATRIGLGQLRSSACGYLEQVLAGETIEVVRRGSVAGRIVPIAGGPQESPVLRPADGGLCKLDELRTRAGRLFDRVATGEAIDVLWRGSVVAWILPAVDGRGETADGAVAADDRICRVDDFRRRTGRYLDRVAAGETIEVTRRGAVVARISSAHVVSRESA